MADQIEQISSQPQRSATNQLASTGYVDRAMESLGVVPHMSDSHGNGRSGRIFLCKLTTNETGGGKYTCLVYTCNLTLHDPASNLVTAQIEGEQLFGNAVYVNLQENNSSTHDLTAAGNTNQKYFVGHFDGYTSESTPRAVFVGNAAWFDTCPASRPGESNAPTDISEDATLDETMQYVRVIGATGDITLYLPPAASIGAYEYRIINAGVDDVTLDPDGSETINGLPGNTLTGGQNRIVYCDGSQWWVF